MFFGKKVVMNEPCLNSMQPGLGSNIGLPAVPNVVLAMDLRPPKMLPGGEGELLELVGRLAHLGGVELDLVLDPLVVAVGAAVPHDQVLEPVGGRPAGGRVRADAQAPRRGAVLSALIFSVSAFELVDRRGRLVAGRCPRPSSGRRRSSWCWR